MSLVADTFEPQSYEEVFNSRHMIKWKEAMDDEYKSLVGNHTWE